MPGGVPTSQIRIEGIRSADPSAAGRLSIFEIRASGKLDTTVLPIVLQVEGAQPVAAVHRSRRFVAQVADHRKSTLIAPVEAGGLQRFAAAEAKLLYVRAGVGIQKNTFFASNVPFTAKVCDKQCGAMIGKWHVKVAKRSGTQGSPPGIQKGCHTQAELYRIPPKLVRDILDAM